MVRRAGFLPLSAAYGEEEMDLMAYGHAERTLAAIRLLEAETRELLSSEDQPDPEAAQWLRDAAQSAARRLRQPVP